MGEHTFAVIIEQGGNNFSAYSPDLPGCVTTGKTKEETLENMKAAIAFHLEGLRKDAEQIPDSSSVGAYILTV
jgi:predicted RNase H-like HicB family nuclease